MDKIIKRFLIILALAFNANIEVTAAEPETVTFQGAVTRHALSDKSVEVSGIIRFEYDSPDYDAFIDHPFTIPAGHSATAYSKTLSWDLPGSIRNNPERRYFSVSVNCLVNCEEANVRERFIYDGERFGQDERDDAYIVNFNLEPINFLIEAQVELPNQQIAEEDIPFQFVILVEHFSHINEGVSSRAYEYTIKQGESKVNISAYIDVDVLQRGGRGNKIRLGYQCVSSACDRAGLLHEAWLGSDKGDVYTEQWSSIAIDHEVHASKPEGDDFMLNITKPIEMFSRDKQVDITIKRIESTDAVINGKIIVEEVAEKLSCYFENGGDTWDIIDFQENFDFCFSPIWSLYSRDQGPGGPVRMVISSSEFELAANELIKTVSINTHTLKNRAGATQTYPLNEPYQGEVRSTYQTVRVECESGCDNTSLPKIAYLTENGKFSARYEGGAKRFYQTEEFLEGELLLNLVSPPLITPMLDLLMEEETSD